MNDLALATSQKLKPPKIGTLLLLETNGGIQKNCSIMRSADDHQVELKRKRVQKLH